MKTILVVDDQAEVVNSYRRVFEREGFIIEVAETEAKAQQWIQSGVRPDIVLLDIDLKGDGRDKSGLRILEQLRQIWSKEQLPVIIVSGTGDTTLLINSIHAQGADDYIIQPIDDYKGFLLRVNQFIARNRGQQPANAELAGSRDLKPDTIIGSSRPIMALTLQVLNAAKYDFDTLILGETGTGKDLIAKVFHQLSRRAEAPLLVINCPEIPKDLAESELFGYEGKSFTSASPQGRKGKIAAANGGVIFFNEIGDLSLAHQAKILNFIETKEITPVGSTQKIKLDIIVLAATNRDLKHMVRQKEFRRDLYYRFGNIINTPSLREHLEDIPFLAEHFLRNATRELEKPVAAIDAAVIKKFQQLPWDGNVRQLEKAINYGVSQCKGDMVLWEDVAAYLQSAIESDHEFAGQPAKNWNISYDEFNRFLGQQTLQLEREYYLYQIKKHGGKKTKIADAIKLKSRSQLYQILRRLNIAVREDEDDEAAE